MSVKKIKLCSAKAASQWTQLSGVKLIFFISYQRLKTQKHSTSILLWFFMNILVKEVLYNKE